ncbi:hypothetical protein LK996_15590 [Lysobacter sp. A6]|uniref:Uncharacterized protein n=1 Tax=Noviluteimonas lactosilytica TaxID=2888523 RepID=A0ABS8JLY2_9GAMM|nr:hypothetical protein [Lysobacter lactosilyticus]MCC8364494.1 hypothetical protein [Lysobacter lactosilyticus]
MTPDTLAARAAAAHDPSTDEITRYLPDGDRTAAQLSELARDATPDRCDLMLVQLEGARQIVSMLRASLIRGECGDGSE